MSSGATATNTRTVGGRISTSAPPRAHDVASRPRRRPRTRFEHRSGKRTSEFLGMPSDLGLTRVVPSASEGHVGVQTRVIRHDAATCKEHPRDHRSRFLKRPVTVAPRNHRWRGRGANQHTCPPVRNRSRSLRQHGNVAACRSASAVHDRGRARGPGQSQRRAPRCPRHPVLRR